MLPSTNSSGCCSWCIGEWDILLSHYGPLIQNEHCLDATVYLCIIVKHVHLFMTTVYRLLMATSSRIMHHVAELQSSQIGFLSSPYFNGLHGHQISALLSTSVVWRRGPLCDVANMVTRDLKAWLQEWRQFWRQKEGTRQQGLFVYVLKMKNQCIFVLYVWIYSMLTSDCGVKV